MAGGTLPNNGGRVTQRDLYELMLEQNKERIEMERRIMSVLSGIPIRVERNEDEIEKLRGRSDVIDIALAVTTAIGAFISAVIGTRQ